MANVYENVELYITLENGNNLGVSRDNHLVIFNKTGYQFDLGLITNDRITDIQSYLERLRIHAVEGE
jgi:hypothetical protein